MIVQLTVGELEGLLARAVAQGVASAVNHEPLEYYSLERLAQALDKDPKTIVSYVKTDGLPSLKLGRDWRFPVAAVREWALERGVNMKKVA
jgi:hypothetical protein